MAGRLGELLVREKAHTREGDAIAAARRRLPMVELDGTVEVVGRDGFSLAGLGCRVARGKHHQRAANGRRSNP